MDRCEEDGKGFIAHPMLTITVYDMERIMKYEILLTASP